MLDSLSKFSILVVNPRMTMSVLRFMIQEVVDFEARPGMETGSEPKLNMNELVERTAEIVAQKGLRKESG